MKVKKVLQYENGHIFVLGKNLYKGFNTETCECAASDNIESLVNGLNLGELIEE